MPAPAIGSPAPDFTLQTDSGKPFTLSEQRGSAVVLFFYPKDNTPGCTVENVEFSQEQPAFEALGAVLVGISPDSVDKHCAFRDAHGLKVILASDPDHVAINAYGAWGEKKNYGKTYMGLIRTTVLIDADGKIAQLWRVTRVKGHAGKVLEAVQALQD